MINNDNLDIGDLVQEEEVGQVWLVQCGGQLNCFLSETFWGQLRLLWSDLQPLSAQAWRSLLEAVHEEVWVVETSMSRTTHLHILTCPAHHTEWVSWPEEIFRSTQLRASVPSDWHHRMREICCGDSWGWVWRVAGLCLWILHHLHPWMSVFYHSTIQWRMCLVPKESCHLGRNMKNVEEDKAHHTSYVLEHSQNRRNGSSLTNSKCKIEDWSVKTEAKRLYKNS